MGSELKHPSLGPLIERRLTAVGMSKAELARRIGTSRQNMSLILRKDSIDTGLLWRIARALGEDFFRELSDSLGEVGSTSAPPARMEIHLEMSEERMAVLAAEIVRQAPVREHKPENG